MRKTVWAVLFSLAATLDGGALDLSLNGARLASVAAATIVASSRLACVSGRWVPGVPLEDLFPVLTEARAVTIVGVASRRIQEPALADRLWEVVLSVRGNDIAVALPVDLGAPMEGVLAIDVEGTALDRPSLEAWVSWEGVRELKGAVARYAELHDLRIKVDDVPDPRAKLLTVLRGGGSPADVVMVQSDYLPELVGIRALQPLGTLRTAELARTGWEAFRTRDGRQWAVPFFRDVQLVFYNPELLGRPPAGWTLEDLERMATPLLTKGLAPLAWNAYSAYWLVPFQTGFGKERLVEADGSMVATDAADERAITYLVGLERRGLLAVVERDAMIGLFAAGKAGAILSGSYSIPEFRKAGLAFEAAPFPRGPEGRRLASLLDYKGFAVSRTTRNPLLARRLVQYLARPDVELEFARAVDKIPASVAATEAYLAASPWGRALAESLEGAVLIPPEPVYGAYRNAMWSLLRLVFSGKLEVREALEQAQKAVDRAHADAEGRKP